jgi:hypothetical protein
MPRGENSRKNLVNFKKGKDSRRNVNGRPPALPLLKEAIERVVNEQGGVEILLEALFKRGAKGDSVAIRELLDRYYGKPKQEPEDKQVQEDTKAVIILPQKDILPLITKIVEAPDGD